MKILALAILAVGLVGCGKPHRASVPHASPPSYSEQNVREFVTPGRTIAEITNRFGVPSSVMTNNGHIVMWFCNPIRAENGAHPFSFSASFTNGMVENWEVVKVTVHINE
jgi:hypothetical protein